MSVKSVMERRDRERVRWKPHLRFFKSDHLPEHLQQLSQPFCELADQLVIRHPALEATQLCRCLIKLLEAKDCAVRAALE